MRIFMWSGPRNISTALLRSFSNREDTIVYDEPFYSYYLKETGVTHPMKDEIINTYPYYEDEIIKNILKNYSKIYYQKHMSHHILDQTNIDWIEKGINCFLIRHPLFVINSYIKKNQLTNSNDIGFKQQLKIFNHVRNNISKNVIVINADNLLAKPEIILNKLCKKLNIKYTSKMINWSRGVINEYGIWHKHWYSNVINSTGFTISKKLIKDIPKEYKYIYEESIIMFNEMNEYSINNE